MSASPGPLSWTPHERRHANSIANRVGATALVHEAYMRLVDAEQAQQWNSRGHFFGAAAEAMRRILVDRARKQRRQKRGGERKRVSLGEVELVSRSTPDEILAVDEALSKLAMEDPDAAQLVKLCYFADFSVNEAADLTGVSRATAYRNWSYAKAWLRWELRDSDAATSE